MNEGGFRAGFEEVNSKGLEVSWDEFGLPKLKVGFELDVFIYA